MKKFSHILFLLVVTVIFDGCNYTRLKDVGNGDGQAFGNLDPQEKLTMMNYQFISSRILEPKCTSCHGTSGRINLETYDSVVSHLNVIKKSVFQEQTMPKRGALTNDEKRLLWNWISLGAPRESDAPPPPELDPLVPTYESINKHIFQTRCIDCHNPTGSGKRILMDKESLLNSPLELIIPGNSDESGLVIALERSDDKRMPPAKDGYSELTDEEKLAIRRWIDSGATD